jgi:16S rRNA G966 N2-methylase RsmD
VKWTLFLGQNPFAWLAYSIRAKGPLRVAKIIWHSLLDVYWDFRHGTDTLKRIPPDQIQTDSKNKGLSFAYGATRARPFLQLLDHLGLAKENVFVDFGSGKGRAVMIAAQHGFRKVIGVEFSEPLCQLARKNLESFRRRRKIASEVSIVHSDVVQYAIRPDETIFYFFDPFSASVLKQVINNICQSLVTHPRRIWILYNSPHQHDVMEQLVVFRRVQLLEFGGSRIHVYEHGHA